MCLFSTVGARHVEPRVKEAELSQLQQKIIQQKAAFISFMSYPHPSKVYMLRDCIICVIST